MAAEYINATYDKSYDRTALNTFIRSVAPKDHYQNRTFTSFDRELRRQSKYFKKKIV